MDVWVKDNFRFEQTREKKMKKFTTLMAVFVTMSGVLASQALAECRGHGFPPGLQLVRSLLELKLTEAQQGQLLTLLDKYQSAMETQQQALWESRKKLGAVTHQEAYNEKDIREAFRNVSAAEEELTLLRSKVFHEAKAILTPEQRQKLEGMMAKRKHFHEHAGPKAFGPEDRPSGQ